MGKEDDLKIITDSIKCLSVFENKTCSLYKDLAERVQLPLVKSLLLQISLDSQKHLIFLKGLTQSLPKANWKPHSCPKTLSEAWQSIDAFQMELSSVEKIPQEVLVDVSEQLVTLESLMGEAYDVFVLFRTLELIANELRGYFSVDVETLKNLFLEIIHEEEQHKTLLVTIKELFRRENVDNTPMVRFQNPDAWNRPILSGP